MSSRRIIVIPLALAWCLVGCIPGSGGPGNESCGDAVLDPGEQCDDGNLNDHDGCSAECQIETFCGNNVVEYGEECDDGNFLPDDGCNDRCETEVGCGNGRLEAGEQCDDDNLADGDGCSALCLDEEQGTVCGNGILELGEGCDDGNTDAGDGCDGDCQREDGCGNGIVEGTEECDDGNTLSGDGCGHDCQVEYECGNNVCEEASYETCEACPADCCPACGNNQLDQGEECDDGNNLPGDGCSGGCVDEVPGAICGNGLWEAGEECEDGNTTIHDGCSDLCETEFTCGDQQCETAMGEDCTACPEDCCPNCGNGLREVSLGEACDGADLGGLSCASLCYDGGTLACTTGCALDLGQCTGTGPQCGDQTAECSEQCDGADLKGRTCQSLGYTSGTLACGAGCGYDVSGCAGLVWYFHDDFEDQATTLTKWTLAGDWESGAPSGFVSPDYGSEPAAAYDGVGCLGTALGGVYSDNTDFNTNRAVTGPIDLTTATQPTLTFKMWQSTEDTWDGMNVWVSTDGGAVYTVLPGPSIAYNGSINGRDCWSGFDVEPWQESWQSVSFDLAAFTGQTIQLAFALYSDSSVGQPGTYLDNVLVTEDGLAPVDITVAAVLGVAVTGNVFSRALAAEGGTGSFDWSIEPGGVNNGWLTIDPASGVLSGTPAVGDLGPVTVVVRAADSANATNFDEVTFSLDVMAAFWAESFETGSGSGWTFSGDWEWGTPSGYVGVDLGQEPAGCFAGTGCIGTGMGADYSDQMTYTTNRAVSSPIDLAGTSAPVLRMRAWISMEDCCDGANVWVCTNGGTTCVVLPNPSLPYLDLIDGQDAWNDRLLESWSELTFDLSAYAGQIIQLQFAMYTDSSFGNPGMYIDEIMILD